MKRISFKVVFAAVAKISLPEAIVDFEKFWLLSRDYDQVVETSEPAITTSPDKADSRNFFGVEIGLSCVCFFWHILAVLFLLINLF